MKKSRIQKYQARYGEDADGVLSSIAKVARSGRTHDDGIIAVERARHYAFMAEVLKRHP